MRRMKRLRLSIHCGICGYVGLDRGGMWDYHYWRSCRPVAERLDVEADPEDVEEELELED
jgi:hypothetical protein